MRLACVAAALMPAAAAAQLSHSPLPPVPVLEPLYSESTQMLRPAQRLEPVRLASRSQLPVAVQRRPDLMFLAPPSQTFDSIGARPALPQTSVAVLPPASEVALRLDEEVNSDGRKVGSVFRLTVPRNVWVDGAIVIPAGTPAFGRVTWRTAKGMFGKSGKIAISIDQLQLGGRIVPLSGEFRETGRGRTGLTIGMTVAAGIVAGAFVKGEEAAFHAGRELVVKTGAPISAQAPLDRGLVPTSVAGRGADAR